MQAKLDLNHGFFHKIQVFYRCIFVGDLGNGNVRV